MNVHLLRARTYMCVRVCDVGRVTVRSGAQSQRSDQKTWSLKGEVFYVELINFHVAPLSKWIPGIYRLRDFPRRMWRRLSTRGRDARPRPTPPSSFVARFHPFAAPSATWSPHLASLLLRLPSLFGRAATAWMRCRAHDNWVGIDWTAAWPRRESQR